MHPFPQKSTRVIDFLPQEVDFHLFEHIYFLGLQVGTDYHIVPINFHVISSISPRNSTLLQVVSEPL